MRTRYQEHCANAAQNRHAHARVNTSHSRARKSEHFSLSYGAGLDGDIWVDPSTGEVWLSYSTDNNVPADSGGGVTQALGVVRLEASTLEVACDGTGLLFPVRPAPPRPVC